MYYELFLEWIFFHSFYVLYKEKIPYKQEKLAELSKLSPRYITDVERGLHCPTIPKIESIAKSLNIQPYQLFVNIDRDAEIVNKMNQGRQYNQK